MKTFINFLIKIIEKYEDAVYGYHINLDTGKIQVGEYKLKNIQILFTKNMS